MYGYPVERLTIVIQPRTVATAARSRFRPDILREMNILTLARDRIRDFPRKRGARGSEPDPIKMSLQRGGVGRPIH
jgi:hypothetical protein